MTVLRNQQYSWPEVSAGHLCRSPERHGTRVRDPALVANASTCGALPLLARTHSLSVRLALGANHEQLTDEGRLRVGDLYAEVACRLA
jgi:hypothetical protein